MLGKPHHAATISRAFDQALARAELPHTRFHDLRHSAATFLLSQGFGLEDVKNLLGHSTIVLTSNTYGHVLEQRHRRWRAGWTRCWAGKGEHDPSFMAPSAPSREMPTETVADSAIRRTRGRGANVTRVAQASAAAKMGRSMCATDPSATTASDARGYPRRGHSQARTGERRPALVMASMADDNGTGYDSR